MDIDVKGDNLIIGMRGDLDADAIYKGIEKIQAKLEGSISFNFIILDLANIDNLDALGIKFIIGLYKTALKEEIQFNTVNVDENIEKLFSTMNIDKFLTKDD